MLKTVPKTVSVETKSIPTEYRHDVKELYNRFQDCLNYMYGKYSGIKSLELIQSFRSLRDHIRADMKSNDYDLCEMFGIAGRHWVMAAFQCSENLKSNWTNLGNHIKKEISNNKNLSEDEKGYIRYVVSVPHYWSCVLNHSGFKPNETLSKFNVDNSRLHYLHNLICRLTRKLKFKKPKAENLSCMMLDQEMYDIYDKNGKTYLSVSCLTKGKRLLFELKSSYNYCKTGNIQLIYNREKNILEIHKCIQAKVKTKSLNKKSYLGGDKGYTTLLSCSNDKEYGEAFGPRLSKQSEYVNQNTTAKNKIRDRIKDLNELIINMKPSAERTKLLNELWHLIECNYGSKIFDKKQEKFKARSEQLVNESIKSMINDTDAAKIAVEDLSFERSKVNKGKGFNRKMSFWCKGVLDERLEYIPQLYGIEVIKVNAAYTSQFCACCGAPLIERKGKHHEVGVCPNCGEINANTNAAKNIASRINDKEITLYTPHEKIKTILLARYQKRVEQSNLKSESEINSIKASKPKKARKTSNSSKSKTKSKKSNNEAKAS